MSEERRSSFGFRDVGAREKVALVRGVFDRVAGRYDLMNDLMSAGVHRLWKDATAARLNPQPGETIVDCAGGTGDLARRYAKMTRRAQQRRGGPDARIMVIDYNAEMIAAGRERGRPRFQAEWDAGGRPESAATLSEARSDARPRTTFAERAWPELTWTVGDAMALPLPDASADAYTIGFGIRNVADVAQALREARRVLKPGGRFLCLEFSKPITEPLQAAYDAYSFKVIPALGGLVAGDRDSYQYLVESIRRFPDQAAFAAMMREAGFGRVGWTNFSAGVAALHHGWAV